MKNILVILIAAVLLMSTLLVSAESLDGGWNIAENTEISEERKAVFEKAMTDLVGVSYEPVAYLGSQVVAGTNHCFLCKATIVYPNAVPSLVLIYIYEDLQGNTEILNIADLDIAGFSAPTGPEAEYVNS